MGIDSSNSRTPIIDSLSRNLIRGIVVAVRDSIVDLKFETNLSFINSVLRTGNKMEIIPGMRSGMMETAKGDSSMMSGMYNIMKDNPQMMHNNTGNNMMNGMNLRDE